MARITLLLRMITIALLAVYLAATLPGVSADNTCLWHRTRPADEAHYARYHDRDNNGAGCEGIPRASDYSPSEAQEATPTSTSAAKEETCYPHDTAFITGVMNIRESHTTRSEIVGKTKPGYIYEVLDTLKGPAYCWLDIDGQWIAVTNVVSSKDRRVGVPPISGEDVMLRRRIKQVMDYLRTHEKEWFDYVAGATKAIYSNRDEGSWAMALKSWGAGAHVPYGKTFVWGDNRRLRSQVFLASLLVHEACHHRQATSGRLSSLSDRQIEVECWNRQIAYIRDVEPWSPFITELTRGLRNL